MISASGGRTPSISSPPVLWPLRPAHAAVLYSLPPIHKDPFDRMLIAQAMAEDLVLVTTDQDIRKYASQRLGVVS